MDQNQFNTDEAVRKSGSHLSMCQAFLGERFALQ